MRRLVARHKLHLVGCLFYCLLANDIAAQISLQPSESTDHPLLDRFPDSRIVEGEFLENVNHMLVLGSLQRSRQDVIPDASQRIRGNVTKLLYEMPQEFSGADVYDFFIEQFQEKSYVQLFSCQGSACGSSNYWANDIFRNRILYGPERNQYYIAVRGNFGIEEEPHLSLYVITRANRRLYAYVEVIETGGSLPPLNAIEPASLLSMLRSDGSVILPGIRFDGNDRLRSDSTLEYLVELLQSDLTLRVYLVGHLQGSGPLPQLMQRSVARAGLIRQELIERGIDADRIDAQGVGPLAPKCAADNCSERIEMVVRSALP